MPPINPMSLSPENRYNVLIGEIAEYDELARHYEQESIKLQRWRKNRIDQIRTKADRAAEQRPFEIMDAEAIAYHWNGQDPKLTEYGAGMQIVERRATMYAQMAANLRMQLMLDRLAQGMTVRGTLTK